MAEREVIALTCNIKDLDRQTCTSPPIEAKELSGGAANHHCADLLIQIAPAPQLTGPSTSLRPIVAAIYARLNGAGNVDEIDNLVRALWAPYSKGEIADDEATFLQSAADKRRPPGRRHLSAPGAVIMKESIKLNGRLGSRFASRQRPRSPDRQASRDRRPRLRGSSTPPDNLRHHYTEGQRAVLCILAGEVKHHGVCDLPIDQIAALAGVCRTTVQTSLHEARLLGHLRITERPRPGRKNLTNLIEITSAKWRAWIKRGPAVHRPIGSKTMNLVSTTKSTDKKKEGIREPTANLTIGERLKERLSESK